MDRYPNGPPPPDFSRPPPPLLYNQPTPPPPPTLYMQTNNIMFVNRSPYMPLAGTARHSRPPWMSGMDAPIPMPFSQPGAGFNAAPAMLGLQPYANVASPTGIVPMIWPHHRNAISSIPAGHQRSNNEAIMPLEQPFNDDVHINHSRNVDCSPSNVQIWPQNVESMHVGPPASLPQRYLMNVSQPSGNDHLPEIGPMANLPRENEVENVAAEPNANENSRKSVQHHLSSASLVSTHQPRAMKGKEPDAQMRNVFHCFVVLILICKIHAKGLSTLWVLSLLSLFFTTGCAMPHFNIAREEGMRPNSNFFHINDGFHYNRNSERDGTVYFKCVLYERGCRGRAILDTVDGFFHSADHNHEPDNLYPDEMALRRNILERCRLLEYVSFHQILDQERRWFDPQVAARVTFSRMRTPMRNARMANFPNPPQDLRGLSRILMDPQFRVLTLSDDGADNIYGGSLTDTNGDHHIVFVSTRMLERMRTFNVWHANGTFRSVPVSPNFANQVYCIIGVWAHHIVPLAWVLMEARTQVAYTAVYQFLQNLLGPDIQLNRVITDFETAQQNSLQDVFGVITQGCLWHMCHDFMDRVIALGILNRMRRIPEVRRIIRLTFALGLLPENLIIIGYNLILQYARQEGNYIFRIVQPFLSYVWRIWVSRPWMRERMTVFGSCQRTNNVCEAHNRILREEVGIHRNVFLFIFGLVRLEQRSHNTFLALEEGRRVTRGRRRTSIMNDRRIQTLSDDLFNPPGPINHSIFRFLRAASHLMDNMVHEILQAGRRNV